MKTPTYSDGWQVWPVSPEEAKALRTERLERALNAIVLDPRISAWLAANDPQALLQAQEALKP
jgi:hypothetical protein